MKKYILLPLLFLGLCSIQHPGWAGDGVTDTGTSISCDSKGQCQWDAAIGGGETVTYGHQKKKTASDALGDTQGVQKARGMGGNTTTE